MAANSDLPSLGAGLLEEPQLTAALKMLELTVRRKLDGVLQGEHLGLIPGPGSEPGEARPYQPGDDIRRMEWSVTARTTQPHVRQMIADHEPRLELAVGEPRFRHRQLHQKGSGGRGGSRDRSPDLRWRQSARGDRGDR